MIRHALGFLLAVALAAPSPTLAQTPAAVAADLQAGIQQVDEGDLDAAVITLDGAVLRLREVKGAESDLATAHLYLCIAHLGLSQMERAKAEMREAWRNNRALALDPKKFPARVTELLDQVKRDAPATDKTAASASSQPAPQAKGGHSKMPLILLGAAAVVGGGVAVAAGGGGGSSAAGSSACRTTTATVPSNVLWSHTGVSFVAGDRLTISISGTWTDSFGSTNGDGYATLNCDPPECPIPGASLNLLVGRINFGSPFKVGSGIATTASTSGAFDLGVNDINLFDNSGTLTATIEVCPR